jgi:hypothetical protein
MMCFENKHNADGIEGQKRAFLTTIKESLSLHVGESTAKFINIVGFCSTQTTFKNPGEMGGYKSEATEKHIRLQLAKVPG